MVAPWSDGGSTRYSFGALALLYVASHFQGASCRGGGGDGGRGGVRRLREGRRPREVFSGAWRRLRVCQSPIVQASDQSLLPRATMGKARLLLPLSLVVALLLVEVSRHSELDQRQRISICSSLIDQ